MKSSKNTDVILQISIPTYNRPEQLSLNLNSLVESIKLLSKAQRTSVGIGIYNNSTKKISDYLEIVSRFKEVFSNIGLGYFSYEVTGFNIGGPNNCAMSILKSKGEYTWFLPDDDLPRLDAIGAILSTIEQYKPSLIHGGILNKTKCDYSTIEMDSIDVDNEVLKVIDTDKQKAFIETSGIQAQEHVYKTELLSIMLRDDNLSSCVDDFMPCLFGLICCNDDRPIVFLKESLGIFRKNDPNSEWRYRWLYMALVQWRHMVDNYLTAGVIEQKNVEFAKRIHIRELTENAWRPDVLLGFNSKFTINPVNLFQEYGMEYLLMLLRSPFLFIKKISTDKHCRNRFINKLVR